MRHVTAYSLGAGSWLTARIVQRELVQPGDDHLLVFTDTLYEDADAYRFGLEAACQLFGRDASWVPQADEFPDYKVSESTPIEEYCGNPEWRAFLADLRLKAAVHLPELIWIVEGRDIWEIWRDRRFLGNSKRDPCSDIAKRKPLASWLKASCDPGSTAIYFGIGDGEKHRYEAWDEKDQRFTGIKPRYASMGWSAKAPLIDRIEGNVKATWYARSAGLRPSRQYAFGYAHDNCGGDCCKAGKRHHTLRYYAQPERARYDAMMERKLIAFLGKNVARMTEEVDGVDVPLTLDELHRRLDREPDLFAGLATEDGRFWFMSEAPPGERGCGCMVEGSDEEDLAA